MLEILFFYLKISTYIIIILLGIPMLIGGIQTIFEKLFMSEPKNSFE